MFKELNKIFNLVTKIISRLLKFVYKTIKNILWDTPKEVKGASFAVLMNLAIVASILTIGLILYAPAPMLTFLIAWLVVMTAWLVHKKKPKNRPRRIPGRRRR